MLKTKDVANKIFDALDPWMESLSSIAYAVRCSYHSTLGATPGQLVFGPDMLLNISFKSNYRKIWQQKQKWINYDNLCENTKNIPHDYKVNDYTYVLQDSHYCKLERDKQGPYQITNVYTNGTMWIQKGNVNKHLNIHHLTPHFGITPPQHFIFIFYFSFSFLQFLRMWAIWIGF